MAWERLGRVLGRLGMSGAVLRASWGRLGAILGHLGEKGYFGRSWRQDGTLLAGCWDKALGNEIWCDMRGARARVGGCLELEFREF